MPDEPVAPTPDPDAPVPRQFSMLTSTIHWARDLLISIIIAAVGLHAFSDINVEAYPDPAPAIVEVVAQWPGASAEEMEARHELR